MADDAYTTPRLDAIRTPISVDAPAGIDVKYDDDFQTLKTHVDALGAATGDVDFDAIVDLGTAILSAKSKDLAVVGYLMLGLSRTEGLAGLTEGVAAVRAVTEGFWEGAFPPLRRMRGRQAALQFVAERASAFVKDTKATPDDREALEQMEADTTALQAFVTEAMGEDAPAYSGLLREIRESLRRLPKPEPEAPEPAPDAPAASYGPSGAPASDTPSAPRPAAPSGGGSDASFSTVKEAALVVMKVAQFHREADPLDAVAFGLVRAVRWGAIAAPPPTGKIPPPAKQRRDALAGMVGGPPAALVAQGEAAFQQSPFHFWLDLQRLVATALAALGPSAAAAHATVVDGTASLVRRLPGLASTTFQDGTPFADPLTVAWLDEISAPPGEGGARAAGDEALTEALDAARQQAAGGDVPGAVAALVAGAGGPRDRFGRSVAAAELALGAGRPDVALALLDGVDEAIRGHRLDEWDPATAAPALRLLHAACSALKASPGSPARKAALSDRADDAFTRLARIDPALALRTAAPSG